MKISLMVELSLFCENPAIIFYERYIIIVRNGTWRSLPGLEAEMAEVKIRDIWLDNGCSDGASGKGMAISVELDNGAYFMISLDSKSDEPLFYDVVRGRCGDPQTDGDRVFWENGASLSVADMMAIIQAE